jgi:RNA-directed DNA polymerase
MFFIADDRGKRTPGVDGVASLTPKQRLAYARRLHHLSYKVDPVRRIYILKPNSPNERRPLGIPTMYQRSLQALAKLVLEPEWEARFEPNSYGFRPGRSPHDAIQAILCWSGGC